ncbi:protein AHNAK2-like [Xenia sp. Carnegie-2017]|uniref:protein AHNAK2-like n=1 Tax=Xenia sp. Carnegie-2017 TaxID=2897299 RepID=UPI001F03B5DA|nr:protein AHNAK2-like [Xenia sp. Carnegie-2017]
MPKFGFGGSGKSKGKSSKKGKKKGFEMEGDVKLPSGEVEGDIPKVSIDTDLQNEPPSLSYSGSDTSDGHGGRIKRKLKLPSGDINISGGLKGPKGDAESSDSDTSDGKGGRIKRKLKLPSGGIGIPGGIKGDGDSSGSETSDGKGGRIKRKLKLPSGGVSISGGIKGDGDVSGSDTSDGKGGRIKRKLKLPSGGIGISGGLKGSKGDSDSSGRDAESSDSDTSDGKGGRIKRKLKLPSGGIGISGGIKGDGDSSGSETSDGKGGRIKRKLKLPSGGVSISGGIKGDGDVSGSDTSDGKGGRIKRKLKLPSGGIGISGGLKGSKGDSDSSGSETSDGKGGRIKRKLKLPSGGIGISGDLKGSKGDSDSSGSETSDGKGGRIKRKLKLPSGGIGISGGLKGSKGDNDSSGSETSDGNGGRIKRKLKSPNVDIKAKASADKDKDGKSGFNLPKFHMPKFGFGGSGKSKGKSSKKGKKKGFEMEGDVKLPSGEVEGDIPKVSIDTDLQNEPSSLSYSGSDTSDGHGGRIKRKLKAPLGDINISGGLKGPKGDADSSDSDTSDGKGGRIKRKVKMRSSTEDAKYSSSISPKRMKFKLPKFGFGGSKKEKNAEIVKEVDSSSSEDQLVLDKFEIPNFDIDVKTVSSDASKEFKIDLEQKPAPVVISASQEKPVFTGPTRQSSASGDLISSTDISMNADIPGESVSPYGSTIVCDEKFTRTSRVLPDLQYDVDYGDIDFGDVDSDFQLPLSQIESNISVSSEGGGLYSAPGGIDADFDKNDDGEQERKIHQKPSGPLVFEDITRSSRDKPDISHEVDFSTIDFDFDVPSIQVKQNSGVSPALPKEKGKIEVNSGPKSSFLSNMNTSTTSYSTTSVTKSVTLKTTIESKVESGADVNDLDTQINAMEPGDITELIRSSSRSGRLSLETKGVGNSRRPVSMDVSKSGARTLLSIANSQRSLSSENIKEETTRRPKSVTVILKEDDGKMTASVSTPKSPSMRVYTKQGNPDVGLQGLKEIAVEEQHGGLDRVSVQKQVSSSTTSSSRTTVTTQTYIRQGPSSPSSYPELLDKEIRQVKASSEKGSDTLEERRRWSMEKRSQWMLSSPKSDSDGGEEKRLTLRDRKKLQQVDDENKNQPIKR